MFLKWLPGDAFGGPCLYIADVNMFGEKAPNQKDANKQSNIEKGAAREELRGEKTYT